MSRSLWRAALGGPNASDRPQVTTVTLVGYGSVVGNVGAQAQILVNGKPVSGLMEFKPAVDPSGYQTFTVSFDNPGPITSIDINLANATPGRALHIKDFLINGIALTPADAANASSPGTFDLYVHNIHVDTTNHQDWITGASTDNDVIEGGAGDDAITGGAGDDLVAGGDGIDTARFSGNARDYDISVVDGQLVASDRIVDRDGTDHLEQLEFLQFADGTISAGDLLASLANSSGSQLQVLATDGDGNITGQLVRYADGSGLYSFQIAANLAPQQPANSDAVFESAGPEATGHLLDFLKHFTGGLRDRLILDTSHPQIALEEAAVRNAAAVGGISNSMGPDTFVFSENVRQHAGSSKTAGSTDHGALQIDPTIAADIAHLAVRVVEHDGAIDASVTPTGVTSLPADHLLFT